MDRGQKNERIMISDARKEVILDKCGGICLHCGKPLKIHENFTVEHIVPLSKGGTNDLKNLVALCKDCNKEKSNDITTARYYNNATKVLMDEIDDVLGDYIENVKWINRDNFFVFDYLDSVSFFHNQIGRKIYKTKIQYLFKTVHDARELIDFRTAYIEQTDDRHDRRALLELLGDDAVKHKLQSIEYNGKFVCYVDQHTETASAIYGEYEGAMLFRLTIYTDTRTIKTSNMTAIAASYLANFVANVADSHSYEYEGLEIIVLETPSIDSYGVKLLTRVREEDMEHWGYNLAEIHDGTSFFQITNFYVIGSEEKTRAELPAFDKKHRKEMKKRTY